MIDLGQFLIESNMIEGLFGVRQHEIDAAETFLRLEKLTIGDIATFVIACQPNGYLRMRKGMDVYVGKHTPPPGGPELVAQFELLLEVINVQAQPLTPFEAYCAYETLHPFMDGNGRSGRMVWLWMHARLGHEPDSFLRLFHYEALDNHDSRR